MRSTNITPKPQDQSPLLAKSEDKPKSSMKMAKKKRKKSTKKLIEEKYSGDYLPDAPDLEEEKKDHRTEFEHTLAEAMDEEMEQARIDRLLVKEATF